MKTGVYVGFALAVAAGSAYAADSLLLVATDPSYSLAAQSKLAAVIDPATGKPRFSRVDVFSIDLTLTTPTLPELTNYNDNDVLAWINSAPLDGQALGDVLASFYNLGGKHVTIAAFAFANSGGITGGIMTPPYVGLLNSTTYANPSGKLVAVVPTDPVFSGITLGNVTYYHSSAFASPALATGATLLAIDGAGMNMIARSENGVMNINLYPGFGAGTVNGTVENNAEFYNLVANTFTGSASTGSPGGDPPPGPAILGIPGKCILWPPNGQMVQVATLSVSPPATLDVNATSSETPDPGETDIVITPPGSVLVSQRTIQLRAQRSGRTGARIYTVTATAGTTVSQFTCTVPHDQEALVELERTAGGR
jgi:hypothetical protein